MSKFTETRDEVEARAKPFFLAYQTNVAEHWLDHVFTAFLTIIGYIVIHFLLR